MSDEHRFCVSCGAQLPEGSRFCTECGSSTDGGYTAPRMSGTIIKGGRSIVPIMILVYGIVGLLYGLSTLAESVAMDYSTYQEMAKMFDDIFIENGYEPVSILPAWSDSTKMLLIVSAIFGTLSPLAALGSYYFCYKQGPKKNAVYLCIAATVLILGTCCFSTYIILSVPAFIIGALITYMLYNSKDVFAEGSM